MLLPAAWLFLVVLLTLSPFDFQLAPEGWGRTIEETGRSFQESLYVQRTAHRGNALNVLLFVPLGVWLRHRWHGRIAGPALFAAAAAVGLACSLGIECLQGLLPSRRPSLVDLMTNTGGTLLGALAHAVAASPVRTAAARLQAGSLATLAGLLAAFTVLALLGSAALQARSRLSAWSADYPLLVGNERTGTRPWRGRVFAIELTDAALPAAAMRRFSAGEPPVLPGHRLAAFDLSGRPPYVDASGTVPDLLWVPGAPATNAPWQGHPWLQSDGPATALALRLRETSSFTLRVLCATADIDQDGPARIVSNSTNSSLRNFTLGQRGPDLVFRLRTPVTGLNGHRPEIVVREVFGGRELRDIVVAYDGATLQIAVAGSGRVHGTELSPGASLALLTLADQWREPLLAALQVDELRLWKMAYLVALFVLPGAVLVLVLQRGHLALAAAWMIWMVMFALLLEVTLALVSGRRPGSDHMIVTALTGLAVAGGMAGGPAARRLVRWAIGGHPRPDRAPQGPERLPVSSPSPD